MEAVSKTGWLADVLLEIAGMSLAASPTEGVSPLVLRFRALFCLFSFSPALRSERWLSVCGKGLGD